jgi:hypothetical protein
MTGCTTVFDHSYVFQNGCRVDDQIAAAKEIGTRFHACRGSMSLGESKGGLPPDDCVESAGNSNIARRWLKDHLERLARTPIAANAFPWARRPVSRRWSDQIIRPGCRSSAGSAAETAVATASGAGFEATTAAHKAASRLGKCDQEQGPQLDGARFRTITPLS